MLSGILLIDKPSGWTSFDVVNYVRKMVAAAEGKKPKNVKVGHTGTLDPLATGLLVLLIGNCTKRAQELSKLDKTYGVTMLLGQTSSTGDGEGEIVEVESRKKHVTRDEVEAGLMKFTGEIMQTPPAYSAVKVDGQRAYKLARAGKKVEIEPRKIKVHSIRLTDYSFPNVKFIAEVSSGTYVRTLVEDIGKELGVGAYMSGLRRTHVEYFDLNNAHDVKENNLLDNVFTH